MLVGLVMVITAVSYQQDSTPPAPPARDTVTPPPVAVPAPPPPPVPVPAPPQPTIEQLRYMDGLKTVTRGIAQIKNGLDRVARTQSADSLTRRRAARRLGGLCGSGRSFIVTGRPKMQATAYEDTLRVLARQVTVRLDSLTRVLPNCEKTAGRDPTVAPNLTTRLQKYDEALAAFRNALRPDSTKTVSQQ